MVHQAQVPAFSCREGIAVGDELVAAGDGALHLRRDAAGRLVVWDVGDDGELVPVVAFGEPGDSTATTARWLHTLAAAARMVKP